MSDFLNWDRVESSSPNVPTVVVVRSHDKKIVTVMCCYGNTAGAGAGADVTGGGGPRGVDVPAGAKV